MDVPIVRIGVKKWQGQISNASPHQLEAGAAQSQNNARCQVLGQMDVRPGIVPVTFANQTTQSSSPVIALAYYNADINPFLVYQTADGNIKAGSSPSL